jgi:hypothetical protein
MWTRGNLVVASQIIVERIVLLLFSVRHHRQTDILRAL